MPFRFDEETMEALLQLDCVDFRELLKALYQWEAEEVEPELDERMSCIFALVEHIAFLQKVVKETMEALMNGVNLNNVRGK